MKKQLWADGALLAVVIMWGYTFVAIKNALDEIEPFNFIMIRFVIAFFLLALIFYKRLLSAGRETYIAGFKVGIFLSLPTHSRQWGLNIPQRQMPDLLQDSVLCLFRFFPRPF